MTIQIYDEKNYLDEFATTQGTLDFFKYMKRFKTPAIRKLITKGWADPDKLTPELEKINGSNLPKEIAIMFGRLRSASANAKVIVILSDGTGK